MSRRFEIQTVFTGVDRFSAPVTRMQNRLGRFTRRFNRSLRAIGRTTRNVGKSLGGLAKAMVKVGAGSALALGTTITLLNKASVKSQIMSKALGVNVDQIEKIAAALAPVGFEFDNVTDLIEEMNNKIGESKGLGATTPVAEALAIIGLRFSELEKLNPGEQFEKITNAMLKLDDAQQAQSAGDILFGGEAQSVLGALRLQGDTLDEITSKFDDVSFRTERGRRGAERFTITVSKLMFAFGSVAKEAAGLAGEALAPLMEKLIKFFRNIDREVLQTRLLGFIDSLKNVFGFLTQSLEGVTFDSLMLKLDNIVMAFGAVADAIVNISNAVVGVKDFFFGEDENEDFGLGSGGARRRRSRGGRTVQPEIVGPQERATSILEERKTTGQVDIRIKDDTGRAEVKTSGKGLALASAGGF